QIPLPWSCSSASATAQRIGRCWLQRPDLTLPLAKQPNVTSLAIHRLDRAQVSSMVQSLAEGQVLPPAVMGEILAKTDGVPLFVEEITKAALESATSEPRPNAQLVVVVPDTLHDSLMARLDQLAPVKTVAQIAAVIGREFSFELLKTVAPFSEQD